MRINPIASATLIILAAGAAPALAHQADPDPIARVYDARELGAMLASSDQADPVRRAADREDNDEDEDDGGLTAAQGIFEKLSASLGMTMEAMLPGVFMVTGAEADHKRLTDLVEAVRRVHADRFEVQIGLWTVESSRAPALGSTATPPADAVVTGLTTARLVRTPVSALAYEWHLWGWQPVVSTNAVGNEPRFEAEPTGLWLTLTVGSDEGKGRVALRGRGVLLSASVETLTPRIGEVETTVQLPRSRERTVRLDTAVGPELSVVMIAPGFEDGKTLVLAAGAKPVPPRP
jgi:hypothetical protein